MAAAHPFCPGYTGTFKTLVNDYPDQTVYPSAVYRTEWGPIFHRGRLNHTAQLLVIGQDPAAHENACRRILVGKAGLRLQGFLKRLGVGKKYVLINTFVYSAYDQQAANANAAGIAAYRHRWLDALLKPGTKIKAVLGLGAMAQQAWNTWKLTPTGIAAPAIPFVRITHPTADAHPNNPTAALLQNWNTGLLQLAAVFHTAPAPYGNAWNVAADQVPIPEDDLPAGMPPWMGAAESWAVRVDPPGPQIQVAAPPDNGARYTRRHLLVEVPSTAVP